MRFGVKYGVFVPGQVHLPEYLGRAGLDAVPTRLARARIQRHKLGLVALAAEKRRSHVPSISHQCTSVAFTIVKIEAQRFLLIRFLMRLSETGVMPRYDAI